jgi:hypothetical protein
VRGCGCGGGGGGGGVVVWWKGHKYVCYVGLAFAQRASL